MLFIFDAPNRMGNIKYMRKRKLVNRLLIIAFLVLIVSLVRGIAITVKTSRQVEALAKDVETLQQVNDDYKEELAYRETPNFVEQEARNKLNMIQPGETVVIINQPQEVESVLGAQEVVVDNRASMEIWRDLFVDGVKGCFFLD